MNWLLLAVSVIMNVLSCGILRNDFCKKEISGNADLNAFNAVSSLLSAATLAVIAAVSGSLCVPSVYTLCLGVVFGLATALCAILHMKALEMVATRGGVKKQVWAKLLILRAFCSHTAKITDSDRQMGTYIATYRAVFFSVVVN